MSDFAIVGGGIVGLSLAYGLLRLGKRVCLFDEGDIALRASRGNFGLVWVQSKGFSQPEYSHWTRRSAALYKKFSDELQNHSGLDILLEQDGGFTFHMNEAELDADRKRFANHQQTMGGDFPFEVLGHNALKAEEPNIGPNVAGAIYCPEDGHLNPLRLLQALTSVVVSLGGEIKTDSKVATVTPSHGEFVLSTVAGQHYSAEKVVLAAGLGALSLGPALGFKTPIRPQQGQILVTEKLPKLIHRPNVEIRQVNDGGVQIGASHSEVGFEEGTDIRTIGELANNAIKMFPKLQRAQLVRSWAALRILSPDGLPIYQQSDRYPGAYFVTCHSGITLAAAHTKLLSLWLTEDPKAPDLSVFSEERF
ncbi:MAG: FAD-binding oxidoreductase [Gammaproteobacteria bacterium]|nr:FAD-binding oxidoreductase [Gammaproteobacteria bacterium]